MKRRSQRCLDGLATTSTTAIERVPEEGTPMKTNSVEPNLRRDRPGS